MKLRSNKLDAMTFNSIADLKSFPSSRFSDGAVANVLGYYAPGDGGGGEFVINLASVAADNGGTVIAPDAGSGRWERVVVGGVVNLLEFGCVGDGVEDDTAGAQAAFATAFKKIVVPAGTFLVDGVSSSVADREIEIVGTLKKRTTATSAVLTITGAGTSVTGDGTIDGSNSLLTGQNTNLTDWRGISIVSADNVKVDGVSVLNTHGNGIGLDSSDDCELLDVTLTGSRSRAISSENSNRTKVVRCRADSTIKIMSSGDLTRNHYVSGNIIDFTSSSLIITQPVGGATFDGGFYVGITVRAALSTISGNYVYCDSKANGMGISPDRAYGHVVSGNHTFDCTFAHIEVTGDLSTPPADLLESAGTCTITGNRMINKNDEPLVSSRLRGITVPSAAVGISNVTITGNIFKNCALVVQGAAASASRDATWFSNWTVSGNVFDISTDTDQYPIDIEKCYNWNINSNIWNRAVDSATLSLVLIRSACESIFVYQNNCRSCQSFVACFAATRDLSVIGNTANGASFSIPVSTSSGADFSGRIVIDKNECAKSSNQALYTFTPSDDYFTFVNTGSALKQDWGRGFNLNTGNTAGSTSLARITTFVMPIQQNERPDILDWDQLTYFGVRISDSGIGTVYDAGAGHLSRVIFGQRYDNTVGAIKTDDKSVGIEIRGLEVFGFACDASSVTFTDSAIHTFTNGSSSVIFGIKKLPAGNVVFEVDGAYAASLKVATLNGTGGVQDTGMTCFAQNGTQASGNNLRVETITASQMV